MTGGGAVAQDGLRLDWPRRDQAWLAGLEAAGREAGPEEIRVLLAAARDQGARVVRTVLPATGAGDAPGGAAGHAAGEAAAGGAAATALVAAGFRRGPAG